MAYDRGIDSQKTNESTAMLTDSEHAVICVQLGRHQDCDTIIKKSSNVSPDVYVTPV